MTDFSSISIAQNAQECMKYHMENLAGQNADGFSPTNPFSVMATANGKVMGGTTKAHHRFDEVGSLQSGGPLDTCSEDGFFPVRLPDGSTGYKRSLSCHLNKESALVDAEGNQMLMLPLGADGNPAAGAVTNLTSLKPVTIQKQQFVHPTSKAGVCVTLPPVTQTADGGENSGIHEIDVPVIDSLGANHILRLTFTAGAANTNAWTLTGALHTPGADNPIAVNFGGNANNAITFHPDGRLNQIGGNAAAPFDITIPNIKGQARTVGQPTRQINLTLDLTGSQQIGTAFNANVETDGDPAGAFDRLEFDQNNILLMKFKNGATKKLAQAPLATFTDMQALEYGNNNTLKPKGGVEPSLHAVSDGAGVSVNPGYTLGSAVDPAKEITGVMGASMQVQIGHAALGKEQEAQQSLLRVLS